MTVCVQDRACLLGDVVDGEVVLSDPGNAIMRWWEEVPTAFPGTETDAVVVMPNHIHGIIVLGSDPSMDGFGRGNRVVDERGRHGGLPLRDDAAVPERGARGDRNRPDAYVGADLRVCPASLPRLMQWFKTVTTNAYIQGIKQQGWPPFRGRLWQRNDYGRIIRNDRELERTRAYIAANPARWAEDGENPFREA